MFLMLAYALEHQATKAQKTGKLFPGQRHQRLTRKLKSPNPHGE